MTDNDYLTTAEAAAIIGVTPAHLRRLLAAGRVRGIKMGRDWMIAREDLAGVTRQRKPKGEGK